MQANKNVHPNIPKDDRKRAEYFLQNLKSYIKDVLKPEFTDEEALAYAGQRIIKYGDSIWDLFQKFYNIEKILIDNYSIVKTANLKGIKPNIYFKSEKKLVDNLLETLNKNFNLINKIHPSDFEFVVARLLEKFNYSVEVTSQTKDSGFDIIALSGDKLPIKQLVECKRYKNKVDISIIRSFLYVIDKENANQGVIFTTSSYTKDAVKEANQFGHKIQLIDSTKLRNWIEENVQKDDDLPF